MNKSIMLGYDYLFWQQQRIQSEVLAPLNGHFIVVGGSGSGKSTAVLYWLYKARHFKTKLYIADFKASNSGLLFDTLSGYNNSAIRIS